jgi:hypothetical protein
MTTLKNIAVFSFVLLAIIGLTIDAWYVYYLLFNKDITIGTNYVTTIETTDMVAAEDLTPEQIDEYEGRYFMVANYFDNSNNNGAVLQELQFNYASDYELNGSFATGMQYLGDYDHKQWLKQNPSVSSFSEDPEAYVSSAFNYYDTWDRISWKSTTNLSRENAFIISIDGEPYSIELNGTIKGRFLWGLWGLLEWNSYYYIYPDLFQAVMDAIETNSERYGDWYFKMDLSKFFTIKKYDPNTGDFMNDDVTDVIKNYVMVKVHYEANGVVDSSQSIFGIIENDPAFTNNPIEPEYWQERVVYNLTQDDLVLRYSTAYNGYFASLSIATKQLFANMPRTKVNIQIDLSEDIIGLDYNSFENFELDTLTLISDTSKTFYFLDKALYNTSLNTLQKSANLTLNFATNSVNNEYQEVIL